MLATQLMRTMPLGLCVAGRKRDYVMRALDLVWRDRGEHRLATEFGTLTFEFGHTPQRFLCQCFYNVLRYYSHSELGRYLRATARPGSTFLDIGANLGVYALLAQRVGMRTIVVEPEPAHAAFLQRNESVFGKVLPIALGDAAGELPLYYDDENPGGTSFCQMTGYHRGAGTVPVRTFSAIAAQGDFGDLANLQLIKVDVEGFEVELIQGMSQALADSGFRPDIWCEVRGDTAGRARGSYRRVRELLAQYGYVARDLKQGREQPINEKELSERVVYDLLFTLPRGRAAV
jgi:FkbM family methyltransferase